MAAAEKARQRRWRDAQRRQRHRACPFGRPRGPGAPWAAVAPRCSSSTSVTSSSSRLTVRPPGLSLRPGAQCKRYVPARTSVPVLGSCVRAGSRTSRWGLKGQLPAAAGRGFIGLRVGETPPQTWGRQDRTLSALYSVRWARTAHPVAAEGVGGRLPVPPFPPALWGHFLLTINL